MKRKMVWVTLSLLSLCAYGMEEKKTRFGNDVLLVMNSYHDLGHVAKEHLSYNAPAFLKSISEHRLHHIERL